MHTDHAPSTFSPEGDDCVGMPQVVHTPFDPVGTGESWMCVCCGGDASNEAHGDLS